MNGPRCTQTSLTSPKSAPGISQAELSIFGPGKGEAIAVHLGAGDWMTVDSCKDVATGVHPVMRYFEDIAVDVATQVKLVVGTHAHDDHMAGIGELFAAAKGAKFVSSSAIHSREFFATVEADADIEKQTGVAVRAEYRAVLEEVRRRGSSTVGIKPLMRAVEQLPIWTRPASADVPGARVVALSPSHGAVDNALVALAQGTAKVGQRKRLSTTDPNELAVALWVEVGDQSMLLGADLLIGPAGCGWGAVLATHSAIPKASLLKVPHHGSPTSHHPKMWTDMVSSDVVSVMAPYRAGVRPIPDEDDVARIVGLSSAAYLTAGMKGPTPSASVKRTRARLMGVAANVREPHGKSGHVQARWDGSDSWAVQTYWPAQRLGTA